MLAWYITFLWGEREKRGMAASAEVIITNLKIKISERSTRWFSMERKFKNAFD